MTFAEALSFLSLQPGASEEEIKRRYREMAKRTHPDLFLDATDKARAEVAFKELRHAVDALAKGYDYTPSAEDRQTASSRPFDPREVYGSTYAYSIVHNPFRRFVEDWVFRPVYVGCLTIMLAFGTFLLLLLVVGPFSALGSWGLVPLGLSLKLC